MLPPGLASPSGTPWSHRRLAPARVFAADPQRGTRWTIKAAGLYLDYSKNRANDETLALLGELARDCGLHEHIEAMFDGKPINTTEQRAVLHTALRAPASEQLWENGVDVVKQVHATHRDRSAELSRHARWHARHGRALPPDPH
jgi:glucose-6-phosphate isomerase